MTVSPVLPPVSLDGQLSGLVSLMLDGMAGPVGVAADVEDEFFLLLDAVSSSGAPGVVSQPALVEVALRLGVQRSMGVPAARVCALLRSRVVASTISTQVCSGGGSSWASELLEVLSFVAEPQFSLAVEAFEDAYVVPKGSRGRRRVGLEVAEALPVLREVCALLDGVPDGAVLFSALVADRLEATPVELAQVVAALHAS